MKEKEVHVLANILVAFSSFIGVAGAIAYYMLEVRAFSIYDIILTEVIYTLLASVILIGIKLRLE